jgi:hypothetical protein
MSKHSLLVNQIGRSSEAQATFTIFGETRR